MNLYGASYVHWTLARRKPIESAIRAAIQFNFSVHTQSTTSMRVWRRELACLVLWLAERKLGRNTFVGVANPCIPHTISGEKNILTARVAVVMLLLSWAFRSRRRGITLIFATGLLSGALTVHLYSGLSDRQLGAEHRGASSRSLSVATSKQPIVKRTNSSDGERFYSAVASVNDCSRKNCTPSVATVAPSSPVDVGVSRTPARNSTASPSPDGISETANPVRDGECGWVNLTVPGPPYFLTVVFIVRIYEKDLSEMTTAEIKQWLLYLRYAGVEHVYLYDLWYLPGESQREPLDDFVREGYLTYLDKHELNPYVREKSQLPSYQHCIDTFGKNSTWQAAIDIDEYPFSSEDTAPGFMYRYIKKYSEQHTEVSEITMENFLYLGEKNKSRELLIDKLWRHTHGPSNKLVKPIYKPADIKKAQVHHNLRRRGQSRTAPSSGLRINHYWGARLQNWGPDTEESLAGTEEDLGMKPIVNAFKDCEKYVRKYL